MSASNISEEISKKWIETLDNISAKFQDIKKEHQFVIGRFCQALQKVIRSCSSANISNHKQKSQIVQSLQHLVRIFNGLQFYMNNELNRIFELICQVKRHFGNDHFHSACACLISEVSSNILCLEKGYKRYIDASNMITLELEDFIDTSVIAFSSLIEFSLNTLYDKIV